MSSEKNSSDITRRDFLKLSGVAMSSLFLPSKQLLHLSETLGKTSEVEKKTELLSKIERQGVLTSKDMPVIFFPLRKDFFYAYWKNWGQKSPEEIKCTSISEVDLSYKNLYASTDADNRVTRYTILPHTMGMKTLPIGIYDQGYIDPSTKEYQPIKKFYTEDVLDKDQNVKLGSAHTIVGEFYPNKVINVLEAAAAIDDFQQKNGGFKKGQEYSYVDILNFAGKERNYVPGRTSSTNYATGGGVCATATNMCKFQILLGSKITERVAHSIGTRYFTGPEAGVEMNERNSDAAVYEDGIYREDVKWVQHDNGWIKLSVSLIPNGEKNVNDVANISDVLTVLTMRFVKKNPGIQATDLETQKKQYIDFRKSNQSAETKAVLEKKGRVSKKITWSTEDDSSKLLQSISPEERINHFSKEIQSSEAITSLFELKTLIDGYDYSLHYLKGQLVGSYLKKSPWYQAQVERITKQGDSIEEFERALEHVSKYSNMMNLLQPIQCVGFVTLFASLKFPEYNSFNIIDVSSSNARGVVPKMILKEVDEIMENKKLSGQTIDKKISAIKQLEGFDENHKRYLACPITTLDQAKAGDIFVNTDSESGHIGAIIGKKVVDQKTILLAMDSNRSYDGRIKIFEVDEQNFDATIGSYPWPKIMIRKNI